MMFKSKIAVLTGTLLLSGVATSADLTTGLAAHYSFDDCKATDSSGNNNNGTITGNLQCTKGVLSKGLLFDGASYISVPSSASLNPDKEWTMAFWVRLDDVSKPANIIGKGAASPYGTCGADREYVVWLGQSAAIPNVFHSTSAGDNDCQHWISSKTIVAGKWLHVVNVIDRVNHVMKLYINGQLNVQQADSYSTFNNSNFGLFIGGGVDGAALKGTLDDIHLYNRVLSDSEIKTLYTMSQPISGSVKGVQQYSATCTNVNTGQTKAIALQEGMLAWNCKKAGLKTSPGDNINISIDAVSW